MTKEFKHSYSTLSTFETCPRQFEAKYLTKSVKFVQNEAARIGSMAHEEFDQFFKTRKPFTMKFLEPTAKMILATAKDAKIETEKGLGINKDKTTSSFFDGYLRGRLDLFYKPSPDKGVIADLKVTKYDSKKYDIEMSVFKLLSYLNDPDLKKIRTALLWLKPGHEREPTIATTDRSELPKLEDMVFSRINAVEEAIKLGDFEPKKNFLCRGWCDVLDCEHNTGKK